MRAMNLLPPEERGGARGTGAPRAAGNLNATHAIAGVGAVVVVGLVGFWAVTQHDTATAREAEATAVAQSAAQQQQVDRLAPVVAYDARRQAREGAVLQLATGRTDWAQVLRATAGALPANVSITTLKLAAADTTGTAASAGAATPTGLAGQGSVTLQVCADTQPRVSTTLRRFSALPQVEDVALSQTARTAKSAGGSAGGTGAGCDRVAADAALGLSAQTIIDGAATAKAGTAAGGATTTTPGTTPTTPEATTSAAPTTTGGTGR